ncbi:MAG TPA: alpha/beta hydrolase [Propionibacteriaceae bacterium]|nr:alpha/beta hydrolase [Propionibacteriaceae bacterium]
MAHVTSADGTPIAYQRDGSGPAVILIGGGLDDGSENAPLARELAEEFTVYNFARRGRGDSGDSSPYAVQREIDDIAAIIAEAGGSAYLFGASSGGMFALEAAAAGLPVGRIAVYEVPYDTADDALQRAREYRAHLSVALVEGRRADAVGLFMRLAGSSEKDVADAMNAPYWPGLRDLAYSLAYDAALYGPPPTNRLARITQPTLVATGGSNDYFEQAADAVAACLADAERQVIDGQRHVVDPKIMAAVLARFFRS